MKNDELLFDSIEKIENELSITTNQCKVDLLKHYLLNFILYLNLSEENKEDSPIKEKLLKISILLDKINLMENNIKSVDSERVVDDKMMSNKPKNIKKNTKNPRNKFKINSEKLKERTKPKEDFNINIKNNKK